MTNDEADQKIAELLRQRGPLRFNEIQASLGLPYRLVDRRLQALRRRGLASFDSKKGWTSTKNRDSEGRKS